MTTETTSVSIAREPELLGQTVVVIRRERGHRARKPLGEPATTARVHRATRGASSPSSRAQRHLTHQGSDPGTHGRDSGAPGASFGTRMDQEGGRSDLMSHTQETAQGIVVIALAVFPFQWWW